METKEAVAIAKNYIRYLYEDEDIKNVGLEEIAFDNSKRVWTVTVGFSRPWDEPRGLSFAYGALANKPEYTKRTYKLVDVSDVDGKVLDVKSNDR